MHAQKKIRYWKFCCALHVISSPIITALFLSAAVIGIQQLNHRRQIHELSPKSLFFVAVQNPGK